MNAIDILRKQQAMNRLSFAGQKAEVTPALYRSIGFDAETGMQIVSNGSDTIGAGRNTNGAIKPNQPVKMTQAGSRTVIDSMPSRKARKSTTAIQQGKVKALFITYQGGIDSVDGTMSLWVGGWKSNAIKIAEYPYNSSRFTRIENASINNLGGDKWIASWQFITRDGQQIFEQDWITRSNSGAWRFSEADLGKDLRLDELTIEHHGFGFWSFRMLDRAIEIGLGSSQTGITGYWLKDEVETKPWSRQDNGTLEEASLNIEESIALYPGRFELFRSFTQGIRTSSSARVEQGKIFLINDQYTQSFGAQFKVAVNSSVSLFDPDCGYWLFSEADQQLKFNTEDDLFPPAQLAPNRHHNWIGNQLYRVELPAQSIYRSGGDVQVLAQEFDAEDESLLRQVKSLKSYLHPLKPNADVLALSYHA
jgi:hypothetical protein